MDFNSLQVVLICLIALTFLGLLMAIPLVMLFERERIMKESAQAAKAREKREYEIALKNKNPQVYVALSIDIKKHPDFKPIYDIDTGKWRAAFMGKLLSKGTLNRYWTECSVNFLKNVPPELVVQIDWGAHSDSEDMPENPVGIDTNKTIVYNFSMGSVNIERHLQFYRISITTSNLKQFMELYHKLFPSTVMQEVYIG